MHGIGPPLVTPFTEDGDVDDATLRDLVGWVEARGVDFLVPCGSNSEAELLTADERAHVVDVVVDEASVPVLAGTGHPGLRETLQGTERAADAGADAALVVTPFYYHHTDDALEAYYETVADESSLPVYLYSVPAYTDVALDPAVAGRLSAHENVHGMKDSSGNLEAFVRTERATAEDFDLLVGSGGVLAPALDAGAAGGVLALANIAPDAAAEVYRLHRAGDDAAARALNSELVDLNRAVTAEFGVPGLKAAMRARGAPAGYARSPHQPVGEEAREELESLVDRLETLVSDV